MFDGSRRDVVELAVQKHQLGAAPINNCHPMVHGPLLSVENNLA